MLSSKNLLIATRPWSFPVSISPVLLTGLYVWDDAVAAFSTSHTVWMLLWTLVAMVLFHAASNLWSDVFDYRQGVDTDPSVGSPTITGGLLTERQTLVYALVLLSIALVNGILLMCFVGLPLFLFGLAGLVLILCYPWLKYHALGDLDILITFGVLPTLGTAYVLTGSLLWSSLWITPVFATITVAVLHANNTRDCQRDGNARITTLAMLLGTRLCQWKYYVEIWLPLLWTALCVTLTYTLPQSEANPRFHWLLLAVALIASLPAVGNTRQMVQLSRGGSINTLDQNTAKHQLVNTFCMTLAFILHILWLH